VEAALAAAEVEDEALPAKDRLDIPASMEVVHNLSKYLANKLPTERMRSSRKRPATAEQRDGDVAADAAKGRASRGTEAAEVNGPGPSSSEGSNQASSSRAEDGDGGPGVLRSSGITA